MADWPFPARRYRHLGCRTVLLEVKAPAGAAPSTENMTVRRAWGGMERPVREVALVFCPDCARPVRVLNVPGETLELVQ